MLLIRRRFFLILLAISVLVFLFSIEVQAQTVLSDVNGNWAVKPIQTLTDKGIIN
ncbi:MAG TPA: S-layer protein, partial [Firmicutes bacterium]|nr:S-layer protein [Bacillota bacterium]